MHYIFESLFVGIYCCILYEILVNFIDDYYILLLVLGFFKHFLGYELHLHSLFCKYGYACQRVKHNENRTAEISSLKLVVESLVEGIAFLAIGYLLSLIIKDRLVTVLWIGVIIHISAELIGLHDAFCQRCIINYSAPLFDPLMFYETK